MTQNPLTQALNLKSAGIFRLLVITTALLTAVIALGAASTAMLQGVYTSWNLQQASSLTIYLPPEADPAQVTQLTQSLATLQGVQSAAQTPPQTVQGWLGNVAQAQNLPLPTVVEVQLQNGANPAALTAPVQAAFPMAEIDDHKPLLQQVSGAVRGVQASLGGLAVAMLTLMGLLITLTTRTGLQAQSSTLHLLIQLGATDSTLIRSICTQVLTRTLVGFVAGTAAAAALLAAASRVLPALASHLTPATYAALVLTPLLLPALALLTAALTTRQMLLKLT